MASTAIERVREILVDGFKSRGANVEVWANESDYKNFIRMYVVSDYFKGLSEKERLDAIYTILEAAGAGKYIGKISLCIAMTKREYERQFGKGVWVGRQDVVYRDRKPRPKLHRLARSGRK